MGFWDFLKRRRRVVEPDGEQVLECHYVKDVRQGPFVLRAADGHKVREGSFVDGEMHGEVTSWHANGKLREKGTYAAGKKVGTWRVGREDGSYAEGELDAEGKPTGTWRRFTADGKELPARPCSDEKDLDRWHDLEQLVERKDAAIWDDLGSRIDALPQAGQSAAIALVAERVRIVEHIAPQGPWTKQDTERLRERVPHLESLRLAKTRFPDGLAPIFAEPGFPELRALTIEECELGPALVRLAEAKWVGNLTELTISRSGKLGDGDLAHLLANPALAKLDTLTLGDAELKTKVARALPACHALAALALDRCEVSRATILALAALPALRRLTLAGCDLPKTIGGEAKLRAALPNLELVLR